MCYHVCRETMWGNNIRKPEPRLEKNEIFILGREIEELPDLKSYREGSDKDKIKVLFEKSDKRLSELAR